MMLLTLTGTGLEAGEARILDDLQAFFEAGDANREQRRALIERIRSDPAYDRSRLSAWLHQLALYRPLAPGRETIEVAVGFGQRRRITLRIPRGYTPQRPWPLIYTLHPSGGSGPSVLRYAERLLGEKVDDFVLAAPTDYHQTVIDAPPPFTPEHPVMLRELRRTVHVDSDRVYLLGTSLGGYAAWTLAMLHADEFAGSVAIASTYSAPVDVEGLWAALAPNFAQVPILHAWGERDRLTVPGFEGRNPSTGTMSSLNRRLSLLIETSGLNVVDFPVPGAGHGGAEPPRRELMKILQHRRPHQGARVRHIFRHIHQAKAYWLEGHTWVGSHWGKPGEAIPPRRGESQAAAYGRVILERLGELRGERDGQTLRLGRRHVGELTAWLDDNLVDWQRPITVVLDGAPGSSGGGQTRVFQGRVEPDLGVCLTQAARSRDFDRLRWAGLRIGTDRKVEIVDAQTHFPPLIRDRL